MVMTCINQSSSEEILTCIWKTDSLMDTNPHFWTEHQRKIVFNATNPFFKTKQRQDWCKKFWQKNVFQSVRNLFSKHVLY